MFFSFSQLLKLPVYLIFSYQAVIYLHCKLGHPQSERTPTCPAQPAGDSACCCRTQHDHKHACGSKKVRCQCCLSVQYSGSARREAGTAPSAEGASVRQYESHRHHNPGHDPAGPSRGALPTAQKHPNCVYFLVGFLLAPSVWGAQGVSLSGLAFPPAQFTTLQMPPKWQLQAGATLASRTCITI